MEVYPVVSLGLVHPAARNTHPETQCDEAGGLWRLLSGVVRTSCVNQ